MKKDDTQALLKLIPTAHNYFLVNLKYNKIYHDWDEVKIVDEEDESLDNSYNGTQSKATDSKTKTAPVCKTNCDC
jgi:hypothetical protein